VSVDGEAADDQCDQVATTLRRKGINARAYYATMKTYAKDEAMEAWKTGEIECIVATIAFGMVRMIVRSS
jgi:superfamily II DNA helicase RecQ